MSFLSLNLETDAILLIVRRRFYNAFQLVSSLKKYLDSFNRMLVMSSIYDDRG